MARKKGQGKENCGSVGGQHHAIHGRFERAEARKGDEKRLLFSNHCPWRHRPPILCGCSLLEMLLGRGGSARSLS